MEFDLRSIISFFISVFVSFVGSWILSTVLWTMVKTMVTVKLLFVGHVLEELSCFGSEMTFGGIYICAGYIYSNDTFRNFL